MNLYPAIDLIAGNCVRLSQGDFETVKTYDVNPFDVAKEYAAQGARFLHVVDLDGARAGTPKQAALIGRLAREAGMIVQSGGGIRTEEDAQAIRAAGVDRVVVGSLAVKQPEVAQVIFAAVGAEHFTLAVDVRIDPTGKPYVATDGWTVSEGTELWPLLERFSALGLKHLLCTDIGRDGMLTGPNIALYQTICEKYPHLELQASGGVGSLADLRELHAVGIPGVIIGKALYEKKFTLAEALTC